MKTFRTGTVFAIILLILSVGMISCSDEKTRTTGNDKSKGSAEDKTSIFAVSEPDYETGCGKSVTLNAPFEQSFSTYRWYECADKSMTGGNLLSGEESSSLVLDDFSEPSIRYFYCEADGTIKSPVFVVAYTQTPVINIVTDSGLPVTSKTEWADAKITVASSIQTENMCDVSVSIKGRGNSSWSAPKKGYNIKFENKTSVLSAPESKKWSLIPNYVDKSLLRNWLVTEFNRTLFNKEWISGYNYAALFINGEYLGLYTVAESIKIEDNRVNIKNLEKVIKDAIEIDTSEYDADGSYLSSVIQDGTLDLSKGGYILEIDVRKDAQYYFTSSFNLCFCFKDPDLEDYSEAQANVIVNQVKNKINSLEQELSAPGFKNFDIKTSEILDYKSFVDWYILEEMAKNIDSNFITSVYCYYSNKDGKIHMGPLWDFDRSFGVSTSRKNDVSCNSNSGYWVTPGKTGTTGWYDKLIHNTSFIEAVKERWTEVMTSSNVESVMDSLSAKVSEIKTAADFNFLKWKIIGLKVGTESEEELKFRSYNQEVDYLSSWVNNRISWLNSQWQK